MLSYTAESRNFHCLTSVTILGGGEMSIL
jgi:hypothetical protein